MARGGVTVTATWSGNIDASCQRKIDTMAGKSLDVLDDLGAEAASYMRSIAPVVSGSYRGAIVSRRNVVGRRIGVDTKSMAPHAALVERGRKPGKMPLPSDLAKLGLPADRLYVVARAIGRKKTRGRRVAGRTRKAMKGRLAVESLKLAHWLNDLDAT